jgi:hypothetical protein
MLKVTRTKEPTIPQAKRMSSNLSKKYKTDVSIEISTLSGIRGERFNFWINIYNGYHNFLTTWAELQLIYFELMRGDTDGQIL